jgi:hypothetical protein
MRARAGFCRSYPRPRQRERGGRRRPRDTHRRRTARASRAWVAGEQLFRPRTPQRLGWRNTTQVQLYTMSRVESRVLLHEIRFSMRLCSFDFSLFFFPLLSLVFTAVPGSARLLLLLLLLVLLFFSFPFFFLPPFSPTMERNDLSAPLVEERLKTQAYVRAVSQSPPALSLFSG